MKKFRKRTILFTLFIALLTTAGQLLAQEKNISVQFNNITLEQAIAKLEAESGYHFLYNSTLINPERKVSLNKSNAKLSQLLDDLFKGSEIQYKIDDNKQVVLYLKSPSEVVVGASGTTSRISGDPVQGATIRTGTAQPQEMIAIVGAVYDASDNKPLAYVAVRVRGTNMVTITDEKGNYTIPVSKPEDVLVFSQIGMGTKEESVGIRRIINVAMRQEASLLQDVVVTGYQTISKERSAGSFHIVLGNDVKDKANLTGNILDGLEGLAPGLNVNYSDGADKFQIRGLTSLESNREPLFVVDGVPMSIDLIEQMVNSNDIETVTILKDATSVSIWGAQAANGVVVILTKKGKSTDRKVKINYDGNYTFRGKPDYNYQDMMTSDLFVKNMKEIFAPTTFSWDAVTTTRDGLGVIYNPVVYPHELIMYRHHNGEITEQQRDSQLAQMAASNNRSQYEDYFMSNAQFTNHTVSFSGGGDMHTYYGSLGYEGRQGTAKDVSERYLVNLKQDFTFTPWLKLDITLNAAMNTQKSSGFTTRSIETGLPYMMFSDAQGNMLPFNDTQLYSEVRSNAERISGINLDYYPVNDFKLSTRTGDGVNVRINGGITIKLFKGLNYEGRFQYSRATSKTETYLPEETYAVRIDRVYATNTSGTQFLPNTGGHFTKNDSFIKEWIARNQLSYDQQFNDNLHQFTALAGTEIRGSTTSGYTSFVRGYDYQTMKYFTYDIKSLDSPGVSSPVLMTSSTSVNRIGGNPFTQSEVEYRFVSFYANGAYTYDRKYSLNASVRVDQSNLFGSDPSVQFKPIWSVGAAWRLSEEHFMKDLSLLDRLTLRLSYGLSGNSPTPGMGGPYDLLQANTNAIYSGVGMGYMVITPANDKLTWEKTRTINFGLDYALFRNRLSGSLEIYDKKTTDLLGQVLLNINSGWYSALGNLGTMTNKGVELSLTGINVQKRDFEWKTTLSFTYNKNRIVELTHRDPRSASNMIYTDYYKGYAANALFAYHWAGLDDLGHPQVFNAKNEKVKLTNQVVVRESGESDESYQRRILETVSNYGTINPVWFGALTNNIRYKNFDLSFMFIYNIGHNMRNDRSITYSGRIGTNLHKDFDLRWRKPGDEAITNVPSYEPIAIAGRTNTLFEFADIHILDASYAKLRDLTLSYSLPRSVCNKISADRVRIRAQASNLLLIAANKEGIDPEAFNLRNGARTELFGPTYSIGLTINFK